MFLGQDEFTFNPTEKTCFRRTLHDRFLAYHMETQSIYWAGTALSLAQVPADLSLRTRRILAK